MADRPQSQRLAMGLAVAAAIVAVAAIVGLVINNRSASASPRVTNAFSVNRVVPNLPLLDENGRRTSLAAYRGKVIVLSPFLTLCSEVCPLTTGAFLQMQRSVKLAGLSKRVVFVEASVDGWRDTPARLRKFRALGGITFPLLTGTRTEIRRLWKFFQVAYRRVPEATPPDRDWLTHKPLTFDVEHTDGLFLIDPHGHERLIMVGMPSLTGLSPALKALLSASGRVDLAHRNLAGWDESEALQNVGYTLGTSIPNRAQ